MTAPLLALLLACATDDKRGGRFVDGSGEDTGVGSETDDTDDTGGGDTSVHPPDPDDTALDTACTEVESAGEPQPEPLEPAVVFPCDGYFTDPEVRGSEILTIAWRSCAFGADVGSLMVLDRDTLEVEKEILWEEPTLFSAGERGGELLVALGQWKWDSYFYEYDFANLSSGATLGVLSHDQTMRHVVFANEGVLVGSSHELDNYGAVAWFEQPPTTDVTFWDGDIVHVSPRPCPDCLFGTILDTVGDVTGDGVEDAVMGGGGLWFVDGELLGTDGGVQLGAVAVNANVGSPEWLVSNVGDFDGDGLADYATSSDGGYGSGKLEVMRGGGEAPFARILGHSVNFPRISEGVDTVGDLDGDGRSTIVTEGSYWGMATEEIWLIEGGLCGVYVLDEVGTKLTTPEGYEFQGMAGGDGLLVLPTRPVDSEDDTPVPLWVYNWE